MSNLNELLDKALINIILKIIGCKYLIIFFSVKEFSVYVIIRKRFCGFVVFVYL